MAGNGLPRHIVLIGHSYIHRLATFMHQHPSYANLGLDPNLVMVHCFGLGGASFRSGRKCIVDYVHDILSQLTISPVAVYIHIGENDVASASASSLSGNIRQLIHLLSNVYRVPVVVVGQLLPFCSLNQWHSSVIAVNSALAHAFKSDNKILFWKHRGGFWNSVTNLYQQDGTHLNSVGMLRYWRSVHSAVRTASQTAASLGY